jgi:hypothetical protein
MLSEYMKEICLYEVVIEEYSELVGFVREWFRELEDDLGGVAKLEFLVSYIDLFVEKSCFEYSRVWKEAV